MMTDLLGQLTAGLRAGLILLAVMSLLSGPLREGDTLLDRWRARGALLLAVAVILYSPAHAAWLLGHPMPRLASRALDMIATGMSIGTFLYLLAGRALRRGLSAARVRRGTIVNVGLVLAIAGATVWTL